MNRSFSFLRNLALCGIVFAGLMAASASAADLGLVINGDVEQPTLLGPFPNDHPNGHPHAWHYSPNSAWSNPLTDPFVSATHSLYSPDDNFGGMFNDIDDEHRSYATAIPGFGIAGRSLDVSWHWNWDITSAPGDRFSAIFRISTAPVVGQDLVGVITDFHFLTDGTPNSNGFQLYSVNIPLTAAHRSFDIIFATGDEAGLKSETGVLFVDDIRADLVYTADFDVDGDVDGRDFLEWQRGNSPNPFSATDLRSWQTQYGDDGPLVASVAVPEPSSFALVALAALSAYAVQARRWARKGAGMA